MNILARVVSLSLLACSCLCAQAQPTGVLIYGATPGGIAAAVAAAKSGQRVTLVEPTARIGGLVTSGLSHVGFCALRLEPIWMSLGQAAGHAAARAIKGNMAVQQVNVPSLQRRLLADSSALIYVSDVLPGHADFTAVQWWGAPGGLHGLHPMPAKPGQRGKNIHGQYFEANPGHTVDLNQPIDATLAERWRKLAGELGLASARLPAADGKAIRGDFLRAVALLQP